MDCKELNCYLETDSDLRHSTSVVLNGLRLKGNSETQPNYGYDIIKQYLALDAKLLLFPSVHIQLCVAI